jgi:hypothetical protein
MKWFVAAALACAVWLGGTPDPDVAGAQETYAKVTVELKGWVDWPDASPLPPPAAPPFMVIHDTTYELDFWEGKGPSNKKAVEQKRKELRDKLVVVQGRLIMPGPGYRNPRVEVTKLTVVPNQGGQK